MSNHDSAHTAGSGMRKPSKCQACGRKGGALAPKRSEDFDAITDRVGMGRLPTLWICGGDTFAADGTVECLRRMVEAAR